jgi:hypothetical protein
MYGNNHTFKPIYGSTITDPKGMTTYYEYDISNRLSMIKDSGKNVVMKIRYNYRGQSTDCSTETNVFTARNVSGLFTKKTVPLEE